MIYYCGTLGNPIKCPSPAAYLVDHSERFPQGRGKNSRHCIHFDAFFILTLLLLKVTIFNNKNKTQIRLVLHKLRPHCHDPSVFIVVRFILVVKWWTVAHRSYVRVFNWTTMWRNSSQGSDDSTSLSETDVPISWT